MLLRSRDDPACSYGKEGKSIIVDLSSYGEQLSGSALELLDCRLRDPPKPLVNGYLDIEYG